MVQRLFGDTYDPVDRISSRPARMITDDTRAVITEKKKKKKVLLLDVVREKRGRGERKM